MAGILFRHRAKAKDRDLVGAELAGNEDDILDFKAGGSVLSKILDIVVVDFHHGRQVDITWSVARTTEECQRCAVKIQDLHVIESRI